MVAKQIADFNKNRKKKNKNWIWLKLSLIQWKIISNEVLPINTHLFAIFSIFFFDSHKILIRKKLLADEEFSTFQRYTINL